MTIGYTCGVFDLFHVGHLNLLRNAKGMCDRLIVGVSTDEIVARKLRRAVIALPERMEIVRSIRYVDAVIPQASLDKFDAWTRLKYDVLFVGDDWYETEQWRTWEAQLHEVGVRIVYFPYTVGVSSTLINDVLNELRVAL
jgi:glycerol-3-phosphate cytidylyltransferase